MANDDSIRFTLSDSTRVIVKKATNSKYDFELILPNGSRKTFIWSGIEDNNDFLDRRGKTDNLIVEAVKKFNNMEGRQV